MPMARAEQYRNLNPFLEVGVGEAQSHQRPAIPWLRPAQRNPVALAFKPRGLCREGT